MNLPYVVQAFVNGSWEDKAAFSKEIDARFWRKEMRGATMLPLRLIQRGDPLPLLVLIDGDGREPLR